MDEETCRKCGTDLPFDEEIMCTPCRDARPRRGNYCSDCGVRLECTCCEYCDNCTPSACDGCGDGYDEEDEGGNGYCGDCYRDRYCSECGCWALGDMDGEGYCGTCRPHCSECGEGFEPYELADSLCDGCRPDETGTE